MTSETSVLTDFSEINSDTLSAGAVWQPWTCFHSLWHLQRWHLLWKTNTWNRQKSLTSVFPCLVVLEVPNDVSADLLHCLSLLPSRKTSCWKYSRHRETDQKGNQILSPEISCSSGWVCCIVSGLRFILGKSANSRSLLFQMTATSFIIPRQVGKKLWKTPTFQTWTAQIMHITASESSYCLSLQTAGNSSW